MKNISVACNLVMSNHNQLLARIFKLFTQQVHLFHFLEDADDYANEQAGLFIWSSHITNSIFHMTSTMLDNLAFQRFFSH